MRVCISRPDFRAVFAWLFSWIYIMCILQRSFFLCAWDYAIFSLFRVWLYTALALLVAPSLLLLVCPLWGSKWVSKCVCVCVRMSVWFTACTVGEEKPKQKQTGRKTATTAACNRFNMRCEAARPQEPFQESLEDDNSPRMYMYVGDGEHVRRSWAANRLCLKQISQLR